MLELILNFFVELIADALTILFNLFNEIMEFDLNEFAAIFPTASKFYAMFQALGIGLVMTIAIFNLFKFFAGPLTKTTERPTTILIRAFFAIGLIYFGNYILNLVFQATASIYTAFTDVAQLDVITNSLSNSSSFEREAGIIVVGVTAGSSVILLFMIIMCVCLVVQFVKMMLEILERFITLCLLVYSSPLAWATFASESSSAILKKWISMFIGQSILMILSAWGVSLFLSVLQNNTVILIVRFLYAFAMVKIIKRFDNYLQQVGLNAAGIGGGSILDAIATTGSMLGLGHKGGGGGGKGGSILGGNMFNRLVQTSPLAQAVLGAKGAAAANPDGGAKSVMGAFGKGFIGGTTVGSAVQRAKGVKDIGGTTGEAAKAVFTGRKNNPVTGEQAAAVQRATQAANNYASAMKNANTIAKDNPTAASKEKGVAAANALRSISAMSSEVANRPEMKSLARQVGETLRNDPKAAFEAMDKIAKEGGLELQGDVATAAMEGYVGGAALHEAFGENEDAPLNFTEQSLKIGTNDDGGHTFDYSGTIEGSDGALTGIQYSNPNGAVAQEYNAQENAYYKDSLDDWKAEHPGAKMENGEWTYTHKDKNSGAELIEKYSTSNKQLDNWRSEHPGAEKKNGKWTYTSEKRTETYTAPEKFRSSNIKVGDSKPVANVHGGDMKGQTIYVKRTAPAMGAAKNKPTGKKK